MKYNSSENCVIILKKSDLFPKGKQHFFHLIYIFTLSSGDCQ